ncbi:YidB family protein [Phenylobacterium sp.]|uniref:YidB family protein n=1 Tax=Phenylobacterium sp. TaxID=1871053 RepID=UPI00286B6536|nr:YidB family protein [Phenylobacterium sp.]
MGLLDGLLGGGQEGGGAMSAISDILASQEGGLGGLVKTFEAGGLGELAKSWISKGENLPISAAQIESVLSSGVVADLAQKLGVDPHVAAGQIAQVLPQVIDRLTPNGELPSGGLGGLLGGLKL